MSTELEAPAFLDRDVAIAWLQREAVKQARRKYGPSVRTSIGRSRDPRVLCNYLGLEPGKILPLRHRSLRGQGHSAARHRASASRS